MSLVKKSICTLAVLSTLATNALEAESPIQRVTALDRMMSTINPNVEIDAPLFRNTDEAKKAYGSEYIKILVQEAHKKAEFLLNEGNVKAYNAFMTLALTVPLQEGLYLHVRETNDSKGLCNDHSNSGDLIFAYTEEKLEEKYTADELEQKKSSSTNYKYFVQNFKTGENPFFPDCKNVQDNDVIRQIIRGGDGTDMGAMQLSIRWHTENYFAKDGHKSLRKTFAYGLKYLMEGFKPLIYNFKSTSKTWEKRVECLRKLEKWHVFPSKRKYSIDYKKVIRGTWAGKYNSGNLNKTCRFADSGSPYKGHDEGFLKNLDKVLDIENLEKIGVFDSTSFEMNEESRSAYEQIISNFKNEENNRDKIEAILN
ncbi:hypothetical protein BIY24_04755 [Halobacteriovorax marinus]|uniref:hypothetical protein n=1 Tax=Halobacteriovorax marinus TaxID=97084 RepID=UPI000BC34F44|nr:hypothetical protein [Halobacteriovorax marinus]ATH07268.1 hypothetical protein BIY24_04755 [Halobacteriovorax marinus]